MDGVAWTGVAWTGVAWTGVAWTGVAWTGVAWTGVAWTCLCIHHQVLVFEDPRQQFVACDGFGISHVEIECWFWHVV